MSTSGEPASPVPMRRAKAEDYPQIAEVWSESGLNFCSEGRESEQAFQRQLEQFPDLYLVATNGDRIVGVVLGSHDHRKGWINRLAVRPEYQRRGIAVALVAACDAAIRARGRNRGRSHRTREHSLPHALREVGLPRGRTCPILSKTGPSGCIISGYSDVPPCLHVRQRPL